MFAVRQFGKHSYATTRARRALSGGEAGDESSLLRHLLGIMKSSTQGTSHHFFLLNDAYGMTS